MVAHPAEEYHYLLIRRLLIGKTELCHNLWEVQREHSSRPLPLLVSNATIPITLEEPQLILT